MRDRNENLPSRQAMKRAHRVRKARRSNDEHGGRAYLAHKAKPWKTAVRRAA